jgi:hypothetical protein
MHAYPDVDGLAVDVGLSSAAIGAQEPPLAPRLVLHRPGIHHVGPVTGLDRQVACIDDVVGVTVISPRQRQRRQRRLALAALPAQADLGDTQGG